MATLNGAFRAALGLFSMLRHACAPLLRAPSSGAVGWWAAAAAALPVAVFVAPGIAKAQAAPAPAASTASAASAAPAAPITIVDGRGRKLTFARPPQRIVSLLPSLTESVCALQQCARLVGVDRYSNWPDAVRRLPQMGGGIDPNIEAVVAQRPDVVLLAASSRASDRLEALGIPVVALEPKTHAGVRDVLRTLGTLLAVPPEQGAERVWREIDAGVQAAAQSLPPKAHGVHVYFEVSRGPYAAGTASFIGETLARLGARNVVPPELGPFPRLNPEFVVRAQPDVLMVGNSSMQALVPYPGWDSLRAVRAQRVCVFSPADADVAVRPGPRMADAARIMARCLVDKAP